MTTVLDHVRYAALVGEKLEKLAETTFDKILFKWFEDVTPDIWRAGYCVLAAGQGSFWGTTERKKHFKAVRKYLANILAFDQSINEPEAYTFEDPPGLKDINCPPPKWVTGFEKLSGSRLYGGAGMTRGSVVLPMWEVALQGGVPALQRPPAADELKSKVSSSYERPSHSSATYGAVDIDDPWNRYVQRPRTPRVFLQMHGMYG